MSGLVKEVITNSTSFERIGVDSPSAEAPREQQQDPSSSASPCSSLVRPFLGKAAAAADGKFARAGLRAASHRLHVHPRFPYDSGESHGCKLCPANLCKVCAPILPLLPLPAHESHCHTSTEDAACRDTNAQEEYRQSRHYACAKVSYHAQH